MDDFAIFSDDKEELTMFLYQINNFLVEYRLKSHKNKSFVRKISEGITFLGFVVYPDYIRLHSKCSHACPKALISSEDLG